MSHRRSTILRLATTASLALFLSACAEDTEAEADEAGCDGGKCDTPSDPADVSCRKRQAEVLNSSQRGFTPEGIRWACADVEGVTAEDHFSDDRGQEYCEYFAVLNVPGQDEPLDFGRLLQGSRTTELSLCLKEEVADGDIDSDNCRATMTEDQAFDLEDQASEVVGACVFTSWHGDVSKPVPKCEEGLCVDDSGPVDINLEEDFLSMKGRFNVNGAASQLVSDCFELQQRLADTDESQLPAELQDPDPFFRGCMATAIGGAGVEWRRSDPSICAAVMRTAECGCTAPGVDDGPSLGQALVPRPIDGNGDLVIRGFALGTWDDRHGLPPGCRYGDSGEETETLVVCDLTGADVLANRNDPKEACREIYGNNIVVHIDLPTEALTCEPSADLAEGCGNMPWNLGDENAGPAPEPDPEPEGDCGLHIAEVFYDAEGADDGNEWIKLYNNCAEDIALEGMSLGWGGSSYTSGGLDLEGKVPAGGCFIVGGADSTGDNGAPSYDLAVDLEPDLQNGGEPADGIAIFDVLADDVDGGTVPLDAVIYGSDNRNGLLDSSGEAPSPHVEGAAVGGTLTRSAADRWESSEQPAPDACPTF